MKIGRQKKKQKKLSERERRLSEGKAKEKNSIVQNAKLDLTNLVGYRGVLNKNVKTLLRVIRL
jgi:hypothetical protein